MIRLLGSVLIGGCSMWLGMHAVNRLRRQERVLSELEIGLLLLERELDLSAPPLPVLMDRLARSCTGGAAQLFRLCGKRMIKLEEYSFARLWTELLEEVEGLNRAGRHCLEPLGQILGHYAGPEQRQVIALIREQVGQLKREAGETLRRQGRVYQVLSVSGGAFLILLLL